MWKITLKVNIKLDVYQNLSIFNIQFKAAYISKFSTVSGVSWSPVHTNSIPDDWSSNPDMWRSDEKVSFTLCNLLND